MSITMCLFWTIAGAQQSSPEGPVPAVEGGEAMRLVQDNSPANIPPPPSGTIILPGALNDTPAEEKKCMTVCARWGEDCTYINRGAGGMTRSCRRTCQQFTEECF